MILKNGKRLDGCSDTVPIGTLNPYMGSIAPYGYLICEGQLVSKTTYKELYAICGDKFGTGTDTEFRLPDLRGKTIAGYKEGDTLFGVLGKLIGSENHNHDISHTHGVPGVAHTHSTGNHTLTTSEMPSHAHNLTGGTFTISNGLGSGVSGIPCSTSAWGGYGNAHWFEIANSGGGGAHNHGNTGSTTPAATTTNSQSTTTSGNASNIQPTAVMNWIVKAFLLMPNQSYVENSLTSTSEVNSLSAAKGKELNEKINSKQDIIADTGWISLPLTSSVSTGGLSCIPQYRKVGNHVYIKGSIVSSSGGDTITIASLPTGFRPVDRLDYFAPAGGKCIARILISAAGNIMLDYIGDWAANTWHSGSAWIDISTDFFID